MDKIEIKNRLKNFSVLFIDDEKVILDTMKEILPMLFKETFFASNGLEGIEKFKQSNPDLIITDLSMPKLDGISMLKQIKKIDSNVKIICISGHNEMQNIQECEDLGCTYVVKPINSAILFEAFEKAIIND